MTDIWSKADGRAIEVHLVEPAMKRFVDADVRRLAQAHLEQHGHYGIVRVDSARDITQEGAPRHWIVTAIEIGA